jgi:hypothetical protein
MPKVVRSARGERLDFDLLKIKQQIASAPAPTDVKAREKFIDSKFKRRLKRAQRQVSETIAATKVEPTLPAADLAESVEDPEENI